jgi:hypothetical protein
MSDHEVDKFLALEPAGPHIVPLPLHHDERHLASEMPVSPGQLGGVRFKRHNSVNVPVNMEHGNTGFRQRLNTIHGVMVGDVSGELFLGHSVLRMPYRHLDNF